MVLRVILEVHGILEGSCVAGSAVVIVFYNSWDYKQNHMVVRVWVTGMWKTNRLWQSTGWSAFGMHSCTGNHLKQNNMVVRVWGTCLSKTDGLRQSTGWSAVVMYSCVRKLYANWNPTKVNWGCLQRTLDLIEKNRSEVSVLIWPPNPVKNLYYQNFSLSIIGLSPTGNRVNYSSLGHRS